MEAVRAISPEDPTDVVLIGFCSGAYQIAEQSLEHPTRGICIINPSFSFVPPEPAGSWDRPARQSTKRWFVNLANLPLAWAAARREPQELRRWINALDIGTWPVAFSTRHPSIPESDLVVGQPVPARQPRGGDAGAHRRVGRRHPPCLWPGRSPAHLPRIRRSGTTDATIRPFPGGGARRSRSFLVAAVPTQADDRSSDRTSSGPSPTCRIDRPNVGADRKPGQHVRRSENRHSDTARAALRSPVARPDGTRRCRVPRGTWLACDDQVVGTRTSSPGPGGSCGPANTADTSVTKSISIGNLDRRIQISKTRHRCGNDRTSDAEELTGLDRIETLGEGRDLMGHDHHIRVLQVRRQSRCTDDDRG